MDKISRTIGSGYLSSAAGILLLGIPALRSATADPAMFVSLVLGIALGVTGLALRWRGHRMKYRSR